MANEISKFYPCLVIHDNNFNDDFILLNHDYLELRISKNSKGKYSIYAYNLRDFKNIDSYDLKKAQTQFTEPNQIGVLTTKKINAWIEYFESVYNHLKSLDEKQGNEVEIFLKSIEGLPINWNYKKTGGEIIKNGIRFKFSIDNGSVSQRIELEYISNNLETFLKLSDNKFVK